jgi:hypothetical protein
VASRCPPSRSANCRRPVRMARMAAMQVHNGQVSNRLRWLIVLAVVAGMAWPVGAVVFGRHLWAAHRSAPALPGVADALPTLDRAIVDVAGAIGGDAAIGLAGLTPAQTCRAGGRSGSIYTRKLDIYLARGDEDNLIITIVDRLPPGYRPHREQAVSGAARSLSAEPGPGVRLTVHQLGEGWLTATAQTDCRASGARGSDPASSPGPAMTGTVDAILTRLNTRADQRSDRRLACPTGTLATTVTISAPTDSDGLPARLAEMVPATAREYPSSADRLAYRDGPTSVIVAPTDDGTAVTVRYTTAC